MTKNFYRAYSLWEEAYLLYRIGEYDHCLKSYRDAFPLLKHNGDFLIMYGKALSLGKDYSGAIEVLETAKNYKKNSILYTAMGDSYKGIQEFSKAEKSYMIAKNMIPGRFYPTYLLIKVYVETQRLDEAKSLGEELMDKEVKIPSTAITEMKSEIKELLDL